MQRSGNKIGAGEAQVEDSRHHHHLHQGTHRVVNLHLGLLITVLSLDELESLLITITLELVLDHSLLLPETQRNHHCQSVKCR
ncbi:hypothetical protein SUGI_0119450 [Cryptomeria japonica]|nr:hypothetical protein SUGI_0119450 [Cryptomeria japonica]